MSDQEILATLNRIVRDLSGDAAIVLTPEMTGKDVPRWDSAMYVNFIVVTEMELGIKFGLADVESFVTFGDIVKKAKALKG
jgi:acyl carrier protein